MGIPRWRLVLKIYRSFVILYSFILWLYYIDKIVPLFHDYKGVVDEAFLSFVFVVSFVVSVVDEAQLSFVLLRVFGFVFIAGGCIAGQWWLYADACLYNQVHSNYIV